MHPLKPTSLGFVVYVITFACLFSLLPCLPLGSPTPEATDRAALLDFRSGVSDDPGFVLSYWNDSLHFCLWPGVTCSRRHPRVTRLDLRGLRLHGSLSPSIGNLTFLRVVDVGNNSFTGDIPPEIGNLRRLHALLLDNNSFSGQLPENISGCSSLRVIQLGNNGLVGEIPRGLAALSELRLFTVETNHLTGRFPDFFGNFSSLEVISTGYNSLGGTIPTSLGRLRNLRWLCLGLNSFSGTIPAAIFNITPLVHVEFAVNQLEGGLPQDLGNTLPNLLDLIVADNHLSGRVPPSIANATNLLMLDISSNNFSGSLPDLKNLNRLHVLSISDNQLGSGASGDMTFINSLNSTELEKLILDANNFGGGLPPSIWNLSPKLNYLSFHSNRLTGSIPPSIGNLQNLEQLFIGKNQLTGILPREIGNLHKLKKLGALSSGLSGEIPSSIGNLRMLVQLLLGGNQFEGNIPESLGNCQNLISLDLSQNSLNGSIPSQVLSISSLASFLDLSQNNLTGAIPDEVGHLTNLGRLDIHDNRLSGQVPESIGHCTSLELLNMENNRFEGDISSFLSTLMGLQYLDVSQNDFSGEIPKFLVDFQLTYLNLSFNRFEGEVPDQGVFFNISAFSITGNNKLCGGIPELNLPNCPPKLKRWRQISLPVIIATACGFAVLFAVLLLLVKCIYTRRNRRQDGKPLSGLLSVVVSFPQISYEDILRATEGLDRNNLIGTGGFGSVYKGILGKGYNMIAIKVLDLQIRAASKSFMAECEVLRNIRHRNLVKILTACSTIDFQGNDFKALVYEYMNNGSLDDWLHPKVSQKGVYQGTLSLACRLNIATEVASAVEYLHHGCETSIVHCDLKPSNVLLDAEMTAHVSDFGLARILSTTEVIVQVSSVGMRGTIGYSPPEYGMGSQVSREGDVYSYGILLLEMFTGKRPTDEMFEDNWNIRSYCEATMLEGAGKIADPAVLCDESGEGLAGLSPGKIEECLAKVFEVGIGCCQESPRERMDIREAADKLRFIKSWFADASI